MGTGVEAGRQGRHRERLLEGLAASIREKGLRGTQVTDVVRHARTSRRTFYECFPDKESCFVELVEAVRAYVLHAVEAAVDPAAPWDDQVDQAVDAYLGALRLDPALTITVSRELPMLGERGLALLRETIEAYAELVQRLATSDGMRRDGVRPVPIEAAVMLVGGVNEMVTRALDRDEGDEGLARAGAVTRYMLKAALDPGGTREYRPEA